MRAPRAGRSARLGSWPATALLVLVALAPLALLTYFSIALAEDAMRKEVEARLTATAELSATVVGEETAGLQQLVESYADRPSLVAALANPGRPDSAQSIRFHLNGLRQARPGVQVSFVAALDGTLLEIRPATPAIVGKNFAFRDWYRGVTATGEPYLSEAYVSQAAGRPRVVAAAAFVRGRDGKPVGILVAAYGLDHIQRFSDRLAAAQGVTLKVTDQRGVLVASPGGVNGSATSMDDPRVEAALRGRSGITVLDTVDGRRLSAYVPVSEIGWTVTAAVPADTAFAALSALRSTVLSIAAILAVLLLAGLILLVRTLRARQRAEAAAQRQISINDAVLESVRDGIGLIDTRGRVVLANSTFERLVSDVLGESARLVEGERHMRDVATLIAERTADPDAYRTGMALVLADPELVATDRYELADSGRAFQRYTAPVRGGEGELMGRIVLLREVTAEYEAERLKSELVATVSHELRTPLTGVLGFAELLVNHDLPPADQKRYLGTIYNEAKRLTALINDFLDIQRIEEGGMKLALEPCELKDVLAQTVELFSAQSGAHELELDVPDDPLVVLGERDRISQVVANLVSNAIKYSPAGGKVTVAAARQNGAARVSVTDSGLGIPADQQRKLFTKFFRVDSSDTRAIGGTGLGLALAREIAEAHGGRMGFESVEGEGSTFWFELPAGGGSEAGTRGRVLVVEDDAAAADLLTEYLAADGYAVSVARTGESGLAQARAGSFALVCLDIRLAGEIDGWAVLSELKADERTRDVPVVICTARNGRQHAAALGAADFLTKPFDSAHLHDALCRLLPAAGSLLVVDDDPTVRALVVEALAGEGYSIRQAGDGQAALDAVGEEVPDAIVLDLIMPALDGFEVLERLQADEATRHVPVVVLTGYDLSPVQREALRSGAVSLLEKSVYSASDLRRLLKQASAD